MASIFEKDRDEIHFQGGVYVDYFNLYPELNFDSVLKYLERVFEITVVETDSTSEGWQIQARFQGRDFLLDTHFHGTSTLFCSTLNETDDSVRLAFLGCFLPLVRDGWQGSKNNGD